MPTFTAPEPENTRNTILIRRDNYEYKLYTDVTLDEIINTANTLPTSNLKPRIIEQLQILRKVLGNDPQSEVYLFTLTEVSNINYASCISEVPRELNKQIASWIKKNRPANFEQGHQLFEQGPCSVVAETRTPAVTRNEDVVPVIDLNDQLTFRTDKYSYSLYPANNVSSPDFKLNNGPALTLAFPNSRDVLFKVLPIAQEIDKLRANNMNDTAQLPLLDEILNLITQNVCENNFAPGGYVKAIGSIKYHLDPPSWPQKVDTYINHPCFPGEKY